MSRQHLAQQFRQHVGISPKLFARICRFRAVHGALRHLPAQADWTQLALQYGYFDQSHLIRDCQSMLGMSPEVLVSTPLSEAAQAFQTAVPAPLRPARMYL